jgi:hypothetical protein
MHYLLIPYALLSFTFVVQFHARRDAGARTGLVITAGVTLLMMFMAMALRPATGDSWRYFQYFLDLRSMGLQEAMAYRETDLFWGLLNWGAGRLGGAEWLLFGVTLMLYMSVFVTAVHRLVGLSGTAVLLMCYAAFPYFVAYAASGLRQGLALVFLLMAYVCFRQDKRTAWIWLLLAPFWHSGAWLGVAVAVSHQLMCTFVGNERIRWTLVLFAVFSAILLSASGLNASLMSQLPDQVTLQQSHEIYFSSAEDYGYRAGFRPDFLLFSLVPLATAWALRRKAPTFRYSGSGWWLSLYLTLNVIYHLFAFAPFADRFAAFSWYLMPLVVFLQVRESRSQNAMAAFVASISLVNVAMLQFYTGNFIQLPQGW